MKRSHSSFLVALMLTSSLVCADLQEHLKKPLGKEEGVHEMRNIDFIYMINMDQRPEKWRMSLNQLVPFGIVPYRFSAVNGWELSLDTINDVGLKFSPEMEGNFMATSYLPIGDYMPVHDNLCKYGQTYFCHCMARGTIGIALSHISILQDAYDSGYETIWVMEDDIEVRRDPRILSDLIDRLDAQVGKENWDVLFTDRDLRDANGNYATTWWAARRPDYALFSQSNNYALKASVSSDFYKIGARYGAHSMIVRRSGMKKLLQFFHAHQIFLPYDMDYILPRGINLYAVWDDVVSNLPKALSDNGGPFYLDKK
ncbi:MAG: glycosyltransferase family 25 protein [Chlamydiales bacterium]|nr:glycosyltransferase family 25 protein [Chlamydiales bacterium]